MTPARSSSDLFRRKASSPGSGRLTPGCRYRQREVGGCRRDADSVRDRRRGVRPTSQQAVQFRRCRRSAPRSPLRQEHRKPNMSVYGRYSRQYQPGQGSRLSKRQREFFATRAAEGRARQDAAKAVLLERERRIREAGPPQPVPIRVFRDAEQNASTWMAWLGFTYTRLTANSADGGIDITSREGVAQVKAEVKPIGASPVRVSTPLEN